jgi:hypothetical protein
MFSVLQSLRGVIKVLVSFHRMSSRYFRQVVSAAGYCNGVEQRLTEACDLKSNEVMDTFNTTEIRVLRPQHSVVPLRRCEDDTVGHR